ncbi:S-layer homology domain-containing protein [Filobacillus milosensis]|uniref:S-layer homology domain-containing protein n=1 Tax=Filobacillus milosensis TaxID=94137 RepID=A0A4Y8IDZ3_9BACI|nr:S-layer homology domain-containing protein [Filobacillus milosensis]TFB14218.1 S-layer homology domain-containing protein [Filobacillus milosensis]
MKYFNWFLVILLVFSSMASGFSAKVVNAETVNVGTLEVTDVLSDWVLGSNEIYAATETGKVHVISRDTFQITTTVTVGTGMIGDLELVDGALWVALEDQNSVVKLDASTLETLDTFTSSITEVLPESIEIIGDKLYYAGDQHSEIQVIDLTTKEETFLDFEVDDTFYYPELESNKAGELYIGESGSSGSNFYKVSVSNNVPTIISEINYDESYGFSSPDRQYVLDGTEIFYAGRSINDQNLGHINGTYKAGSYDATILDVTNDFVVSENFIYDRDEFRAVHEFSFDAKLAFAPSMNEVYLYDEYSNTIHKKSFNLPTTLVQNSYTPLNKKVSLNHEFTDWVIDETNGKLYAISMSDNTLMTFDATTLEKLDEQSVGSFPSDIDLVNGKLYIANFGGTKVNVIDLATGSQSSIVTNQNPYRIATDEQVLYYVTEEGGDIYEVTINPLSEQALNLDVNSFSDPDLELDSVNNILYIGESGSSGSDLYSMNLSDYSLTVSDYGSTGFSYPNRKLFLDNEHIYYAKHQISATDLTNEIHNFDESIINVSDNYVVTNLGIYEKTNLVEKVATFPFDEGLFEVQQAIVNADGSVNLYVAEDYDEIYSIYKFESIADINNSKPSNLSASVNTENVFTFAWDETTADYYVVSYDGNEIQTTDTSITLTENQHAQYAGQTVTFNVHSEVGTHVSDVISKDYTFKPNAPENFVVQKDVEGNLGLTWDPVTSEHYQIFYKTSSMTDFQLLDGTTLTTTGDQLTEADYQQWIGETVTFGVKAFAGDKASDMTTTDFTFIPKTPGNFVVNKDETNNLDFSWDAVTSDSYNIYYQTESMTAYQLLDELQLTSETYEILEADYQNWIGQTVSFGVKAVKGQTESTMATLSYEFIDPNQQPPEEEGTTEEPTEDDTSSDTGSTPPPPSDNNDEEEEEDTEESSDPIDLEDIMDAKIIKRISTFQRIYEYKEEEKENVSVNLFKSVLSEMDQEGDEEFKIESPLGSFKLPINTINQFADKEDSYVQVTIQKVPEQTVGEYLETAQENFLEMVSSPIDFSVEIYENGIETNVTSYGEEFVERRIPIDDPSEADELMVVTLIPETREYQPVPSTIEQDEDGQYYAVFHRNGNSVYAVVKKTKKNFSDMEDHWAKDSVTNLAGSMIVKGVSDDEYAPEREVTRAEFVAMLTRTLGLTMNDQARLAKFSDVNSSDWYHDGIYAAKDVRLISGYGDGNYRPNDTINREEVMVIAVRALNLVNGNQEIAGENLTEFNDTSDVSEWAKDKVNLAVGLEIVNGRTSTTLAPKATVTRAEAAVIIERLIDKLEF